MAPSRRRTRLHRCGARSVTLCFPGCMGAVDVAHRRAAQEAEQSALLRPLSSEALLIVLPASGCWLACWAMKPWCALVGGKTVHVLRSEGCRCPASWDPACECSLVAGTQEIADGLA